MYIKYVYILPRQDYSYRFHIICSIKIIFNNFNLFVHNYYFVL
uniref:Uncharacterized protein n=1 Tax=Moumouvirus sp. 'Monve' TaxID=1128131 RepID=H2EEP8_9VIRU|nr:hypothetical protein mv_R666 [Moumouvirus Monve]